MFTSWTANGALARTRSSAARASSHRWPPGRLYRVSVGVDIQVAGERDRTRVAGGRADHRRVVGAQLGRRDVDGHAEGRGALAQQPVGGDAAADRQARL